MPVYLYRENVSPRDRFDRLEFSLDTGDIAVIRRGLSYDLTNTEANRARSYIVLESVGGAPTSEPVIIERLPVMGTPEDGDVPVWHSELGAFVAEPQSGGGGAGLESFAADTGEHVQYIALTDGSRRVIPIPFGTPDPSVPTSFSATPTLAMVTLSWLGSADHFLVFRDGARIASVTSHSYRDLSITTSSTYSYAVRAVDQYGQWSPLSSPAIVFIDPSTNVAPDVDVTSWPPTIPTSGKAYIRVAMRDADSQALALTLGVDVGSLIPTADPTVFIYTAP